MADFVQGQRWLVDSEPELGLGMVKNVDDRAVLLYFPESDTERQYALKNAPLTRWLLDVGDTLDHREAGTKTVTEVHDLNGLKIYATADEQMVPETELADTVKRNSPLVRLLTGQTDHPNWFKFRSSLNQGIQNVWNAHLNGLLGTRSTLLPHQLYVAQKATEQPKVRVLLSDEVGLGKTIEAGLIVNRLRQQNRVKRVLVAVPAALQAQWLVELVRRFSLHCEFYQDLEHDFAMGNVHLITHEQLQDELTLEQIQAHDWDLLVVDEAHHLSADHTTEGWAQLALNVPHLLLLTATPEKLGQEEHFGRLQLLDAERFSSFDQYLNEEAKFTELTSLAERLANQAHTDDDVTALEALGIEWHEDAQRALSSLLDRHGTGRVVFRNTRKGVAGFHPRASHLHQFESDEARIEALADWLKQNRQSKALLITERKETARDVAQTLWHQYGIDATAFHEDLDLIERDRAAAHFADDEEGAQILVCSEIGGEGRNFQFCHDLILWDVPNHPDGLEQRIGRLDRIGQTQTIQIHGWLLSGTEDAARFHWYNDVLNCIEHIQPAAGAIHERFASEWLTSSSDALTEQIRTELTSLTKELEQGRDVLLELNSCREPEASELKERVQSLEADHPLAVVELAAELLNLHFEEIRTGIYELIPSSNMLIPALPGIPEGGALVTFDRDLATSREDALFLSWEHPFIQGLADSLSGSDLGQASMALLETDQVPAGQLLMETQWSLAVTEREAHALRPCLDENQFRTLVLEGGDKDLNQVLTAEALQAQLKPLPVKVARKMIRQAKDRISPLFDVSQTVASARFNDILAISESTLAESHRERLERLKYLAGINPYVTETDVMKLENRQMVEAAALSALGYECTGVRLILCAPPGSL